MSADPLTDGDPYEEFSEEKTVGGAGARADGHANGHARDPEFARLLATLPGPRPTPKQLQEFRDAHDDSPAGFAQAVREAKTGRTPVALLHSKLERGEHLGPQKQPPPPPCPECEIGGGYHLEGCSHAGVAA